MFRNVFGKFVVVIAILLAVSGCQTPAHKGKKRTNLILATTTSLQDSGLLDKLVPAFESRYPYKVKTLAQGTGEALATAARGDADVILVHAPKAERKFLAAGYGVKHHRIAYNYFTIVGPAGDPADVKAAPDAAAAFKRVAAAQAPFISRGDNSGTNKREKSIWQAAGIKPLGSWYIQSGQGMGKTLQLAAEKRAYTLTDSATFIAMRRRLELKALLKQSPDLINYYSVMQVNQAKFKRVTLNTKGAAAFSRFLRSAAAARIIASFGRRQYGRLLFFLIKN